jgi:hypothetical protein
MKGHAITDTLERQSRGTYPDHVNTKRKERRKKKKGKKDR